METKNLNKIENPKRKQSKVFTSFAVSTKLNKELVLDEFSVTTYEKVINILTDIKSFLMNMNVDQKIVFNLNWVIGKIASRKLYTYDISENLILEKKKDSKEIQTLLEFLNETSEFESVKLRKDSSKSPSKLSGYIPKNSKMPLKKKSASISKISRQLLKSALSFIEEEEEMKNLDIKENYNTNFENHHFEVENNSLLCDSLNLNHVDPNDIEKIDNFDFNIFEFEGIYGRKNSFHIISKYGYNTILSSSLLNLPAMDNFLDEVYNNYRDNTYHNSLHAVDVLQTILLTLSNSKIVELVHLNQIDLLGLVTSCILHDIGHPGTNNNFHKNSGSELAITYNDRSILENFHSALGFKILNNKKSNIFSNLDKIQFKRLRSRMVEMILSTDMLLHIKTFSLAKSKIKNIKNNEIDWKNNEISYDTQQEMLNFLIHTADISHCAKKFEISRKWTNFIMEEFWNQGDLEKMMGITVSFLCDRENSEVPKNQIVFIKGIILPNFEALVELDESLDPFIINIKTNIDEWKKLSDQEKVSF